MSLLKKRLLLDGITLRGVGLDLHLGEQSYIEASQEIREDSSYVHRVPFALESTGEITLKGIRATVFYDAKKIPVQYQLDEGTGLFGRETDGRLDILGVVNAIALKTNITTGPLRGNDGTGDFLLIHHSLTKPSKRSQDKL
jgi:hypothetical protein